MTTPASPSILNYTIGKGIAALKFIDSAESDFTPMGNCPAFEFTPDLETLDHFSSMAGVKSKDRTVVISKSGTLKITAEEWTTRNMSIALLGDASVDSSGRTVIDIFSKNSIACEVKFTGTNEVGQKFEWHFLRVEFVPSSAISPISDEWGQLEVTGNVVAVAGKFGTVIHLGGEGDEASA
ncbi:hypothetical protein JQ608_06660 [Bradyrhizobium liaoningense]|uniref:phage tail tube protein n=1 Tax=Bradyrhizobium liaoningense TaxID=43992 RepID=UPI001BAC02AF|nr:hypothetical protein [Bradyrhizobium liaoningense]MBR0876882.1 hypothetical protein [Bradyrhizobium liaoningense]